MVHKIERHCDVSMPWYQQIAIPRDSVVHVLCPRLCRRCSTRKNVASLAIGMQHSSQKLQVLQQGCSILKGTANAVANCKSVVHAATQSHMTNVALQNSVMHAASNRQCGACSNQKLFHLTMQKGVLQKL